MNLNKELLYRLYIEENLNDKQIANKLGISSFTVWNLRKKFGIKGIYLGERKRILNPEKPLTIRQYDILIGSLLGDCCIKKPTAFTAAASISHSDKQKSYVMWLYEQLSSICPKPPRKEIHHSKYIMHALRTESRLDIKELYQKVYLPTKTVTEWLCGKVSDLSVAVWFMDDGNAEYINDENTLYSFATYSFSFDEVYLLSNMMLHKFGIKCQVKPFKRPNGREQPVLYVLPESSATFEALVRPHIPDCMLYKIPSELRKKHLLSNAEQRIGKETIRHLYYNEMLTQRQMAEILGVHRTTIRTYMKMYKIDRRDNSKAQLSGKNSQLKRNDCGEFTPIIATNEIKDKAKNLFLSMRKTGFPYLSIPSNEKCFSSLDSLCHKILKPSYTNNTYEYSSSGMNIISPFFPGIFNMATDKSLSPLDIFLNDQMLFDCIERTLIYAKSDSISSVRQGLKTYRNNRSVSVFPPMWAKTVIELISKNTEDKIRMLDFSAGFGGRLVGSYASGLVREYIGIDPLKGNVKGLLSLKDIIERHSKLINKNFVSSIIEDMAETALAKLGGEFDLVLTSPPYWNKERYSSDITQCYNRYLSYETWESEWLNRVIGMSCEILKPGGAIAIFASDCRNGPVGSSVKTAIEKELNILCTPIYFLLPNLEYHRTKGLVRKETCWIGIKPK